MRQINEIIVHCSATPKGANFTVEDIDSWHRKPPFNFRCIGYHYVIYHPFRQAHRGGRCPL